jgi:hypothetical protein
MNKLNNILIILFLTLLCGQSFDPNTGNVIPDSTHHELKFDPASGIQILDPTQKLGNFNNNEISNSQKLSYSNVDVINRAKADAYDYYSGFVWSAVGGPSTIFGASLMGNIGEIFIEGFGGLGGFLGGLYFLPQFFSKMNVNIPYYQTKYISDNYSDEQLDLYIYEYEKEIIRLRKNSIYKGQGLSCLGCVAFTMLMVAGSL